MLCRAVLPSPAAQATLGTSCTSISGAKGSQPRFRPYTAVDAVLLRFVDFHHRHSDRRETVTHVLDIVCPRVASDNFHVSTSVSSFRIFSTRDPNLNKPSRMTWKPCVRACRG